MNIKSALLASITALSAPLTFAATISGQGSWETTLQGRDLDGDASTFEAYYDTVLDITWLADINYAKTSSYHPTGQMTWADAMTWVATLDPYGSGITGWRLPTVQPVNGHTYNNSHVDDGSTDRGFNISAPGTVYAGSTASEMAYMFYNTLGNLASNALDGSYNSSYGLINTGPFLEITDMYGDAITQNAMFWTGTDYYDPSVPDLVYNFYGATGSQSYSFTNEFTTWYSWAVHDGDISAVPVPAAAWLFASGLIGLIGVARRKKV